VRYLDPENLPFHNGMVVPANVFVLGAAAGQTRLSEVLPPSSVAHAIESRWAKAAERNLFAFQGGLKACAGDDLREQTTVTETGS